MAETVERTKEEASKAIDDGLAQIMWAIDSVRADGYPFRGQQLDLFIKLVREAKEYLYGYIDHLEVDGDPYWLETQIQGEPSYRID